MSAPAGFDPETPFDDLPALPPAAEIETAAVLRQTVAAARALAELKGSGGLIPNQAILINAIPLQEAKLSSEIENIVTTQGELFRASLAEAVKGSPEAKEVLRYRAALHEGYLALQSGPLSLALLSRVCSTLHGAPTAFRGEGEDVYIGNASARRVTYTPHILYLLHAGLLEIPVLYLSRYLIQRKPEYYRRLREVTEGGEWEAWVLFLLRGLEETALWTIGRISAIRDLMQATVERARAEAPKIYSKELIELIFRLPYCRISFLVEAGLAQRKTASEYLQELERIGILVSERRGREVLYKHPALVEVLTA